MTKSELLQIAKPILFNTDMVQAILENRKGVTRRKVNPQHLRVLNSPYHKAHPEIKDSMLLNKLCQSPFQVGDILYVRETWAVRTAHRFDASANIMFKAGGQESILTFPNAGSDSVNRDEYDNFLRKWDKEGKWNPSIFMPKDAARIFLQVLDVKVQHLHDMTLDDFLAEGVALRPEAFNDPENAYHQAKRIFAEEIWDKTLRKADREYYSWDANPWVWTIWFERIYPE